MDREYSQAKGVIIWLDELEDAELAVCTLRGLWKVTQVTEKLRRHESFHQPLMTACMGRRFGVTAIGRMGLIP